MVGDRLNSLWTQSAAPYARSTLQGLTPDERQGSVPETSAVATPGDQECRGDSVLCWSTSESETLGRRGNTFESLRCTTSLDLTLHTGQGASARRVEKTERRHRHLNTPGTMRLAGSNKQVQSPISMWTEPQKVHKGIDPLERDQPCRGVQHTDARSSPGQLAGFPPSVHCSDCWPLQ